MMQVGNRLRLPSGAIGECVALNEQDGEFVVEFIYIAGSGNVQKKLGGVCFSPKWLESWRRSQLHIAAFSGVKQ